MDSADAKQFLISRVIEEADLQRVNLSEIERKMLYFTEVHPSLPDIYDINAEFERNYDSDEYEAKIVRLLRSARDRNRRGTPGREEEWKDALRALRQEDHYILVMVSLAFISEPSTLSGDEPRTRTSLIYIAIGIVVVLILAWAASR